MYLNIYKEKYVELNIKDFVIENLRNLNIKMHKINFMKETQSYKTIKFSIIKLIQILNGYYCILIQRYSKI